MSRSLQVLLIVVIALLLFSVSATAEERCLGFALPRDSVQVEPNRYLVGQSYKRVLKFYRKTYIGVKSVQKTKGIVVPGVKSVHYSNHSKKRGVWAGANVSWIKGKTYVFCYPSEK